MASDLIRTMLVEDHEITRMGLKKVLEKMDGISFVADAGDGKTAVALAMELHPDLILMDIGLPGMDGIEATRQIKAVCPAKVMMITSHDNDRDIFAGLSAGADGYCLKDTSGSQFVNAINSVMSGALWLDPGIANQVFAKAVGQHVAGLQPEQSSTFGLSPREIEVLDLLVDGLTNHQIAAKLFLSHETIKTHMRHIMEKLAVSDRTQAAVKALKEGLVQKSKR